jgi:hypothetical protein
LKSEGVAYHCSPLLIYRIYRGDKIPTDRFQNGLPTNLQVIAVYSEDDPILQYLPQFNTRIKLPQMPGWTLFIRSSPPQPAAKTSTSQP